MCFLVKFNEHFPNTYFFQEKKSKSCSTKQGSDGHLSIYSLSKTVLKDVINFVSYLYSIAHS